MSETDTMTAPAADDFEQIMRSACDVLPRPFKLTYRVESGNRAVCLTVEVPCSSGPTKEAA